MADADALMAALPRHYACVLYADAEAIHRMDPASQSVDEVFSGVYRIFWRSSATGWRNRSGSVGVPLIPRLITEWAHERSGVDLHPGAHDRRTIRD